MGPEVAARRGVVVGFSNGGAFATLLALHGLVRACGFVTLHGFPAGALHAQARTRPPLLLVAGRGAPWEGPQLAATTAQLEAFGWPHEAKIHDGPHAVGEADLDAAIAFAREAICTGCAGAPTNEPFAFGGRSGHAASCPWSASQDGPPPSSAASLPLSVDDVGLSPALLPPSFDRAAPSSVLLPPSFEPARRQKQRGPVLWDRASVLTVALRPHLEAFRTALTAWGSAA